MPGARPMTVMIVPSAGRRTLTFRFAPLWLAPILLLIAGMALSVLYQYRANVQLEQRLGELDSLRRTNRLQEAQLESLQNKVTETDLRLGELENLEEQLRDVLGQPLPARGGSTLTPEGEGGRGGPPSQAKGAENLPTLGAMLPPEVRAYLFTPRDTLAMDLSHKTEANGSMPGKASPEQLAEHLDEQVGTMTRLANVLSSGKKEVQDQLDYIAHRPNGLPVSGGQFTDRFGWRWSPFGWGRQFHDGLDIAQDYWTPVVATGAGIITHAGWLSGGYGYTVIIDHGYGLQTMYAHLIDTNVDVGDSVARGVLVGWVGNTGNSTGPHVHYEVHLNGVPVDPVKYLQ